MVKQFLTLVVIILFCFSASAQNKQQKIVFDFVKSDTADFLIMVAQINNVLKESVSSKYNFVPKIYLTTRIDNFR